MNKFLSFFLALFLAAIVAKAQTYRQINDISYTQKTDSYSLERLKLDVYYPERMNDCPVIVWFHGGGLEFGNKEIPSKLKEKGYVVVGVNYRLLPKVTIDKTLDDAAEAIAWVFAHAGEYGGDTKKMVVTGHSAGGYIAMMLCLDKKWLQAYKVDADDVMMYVPFSGQAVTHYNVRKMKGIPPLQVTIDEYAPIYWVRKDCPPLVLICGDRELELYGRYDENQYLARMMKLVGHQETYLYELDGHGHGAMVEPSFHILETHLNKMLGKETNP
ncbi:MAG: alpha/beta hydrolase [Prevotella sp.]|jgi:acetyl esterase/lipase|nr:alpha/beta hydrolase [Prevotella sp.]